MEVQHTSSPIAGVIYLTTSALSLLVSLAAFKEYVQIGAGVMAIGSGILAARYYWHATKKIKQENR
mgnify:FL=1